MHIYYGWILTMFPRQYFANSMSFCTQFPPLGISLYSPHFPPSKRNSLDPSKPEQCCLWAKAFLIFPVRINGFLFCCSKVCSGSSSMALTTGTGSTPLAYPFFSHLSPWSGELIEGEDWFSLGPYPLVSSNYSVHRDNNKISKNWWHTFPFTTIFTTISFNHPISSLS